MPDTFPYNPDRVRGADLDREVYRSEPYSGDPKYLIRGNAKRIFTLIFSKRTQAEFTAVETFWASHYPSTTFTFNDTRHYPSRAHTVRFISGIREKGDQTTLRFNYAFEIEEVT